MMTRYMLKRLARAAALRVRGTDWIVVAKEVNSRPEVCRRWPDKYPKEWLMLKLSVQQMMFEEMTRTALWELSRMARSTDPKERAEAEKLLRRYGDRLRAQAGEPGA